MKKKIVLGAAVLLAVLVIIYAARGGSLSGDREEPEATQATQAPAAAHRIDVPYLSQKWDYPCGCESVSAVMALRYAGFPDMDVDTFILNYLPQGSEPYYGDDGQLYGDSPYEVFIGSPYSDYSYGCYAPVIKKALEQVIADTDSVGEVNAERAEPDRRVVGLTGSSLEELCRDYIDRDIPVIVWGTIGMQPIQAYTTWILPDGGEFTWRSQEHCLLLVGYDENYYYFNDPMEGKDTKYLKKDAEHAYAELYSQALAIVEG